MNLETPPYHPKNIDKLEMLPEKLQKNKNSDVKDTVCGPTKVLPSGLGPTKIKDLGKALGSSGG